MKALNTVQPYDWATFLRARLDGHGPGAPLDGIARGGYKLVYTDTPSDYFKDSEARRKVTDLTYSLGMTIAAEGKLSDVLWEGPAYKSGLTVGTQIIAVNGIAFDADRLKSAIKDANKTERRDRASRQEWRSLPHRQDRLSRRASLPAPGTRGQRACASGSDPHTAKLTRGCMYR